MNDLDFLEMVYGQRSAVDRKETKCSMHRECIGKVDRSHRKGEKSSLITSLSGGRAAIMRLNRRPS